MSNDDADLEPIVILEDSDYANLEETPVSDALLYCIPLNAGSASTTRNVCKRLAAVLNALAHSVNSAIASGPLLASLNAQRIEIIERLQLDGWDVTQDAGDRYKVKGPDELRHRLLTVLRAKPGKLVSREKVLANVPAYCCAKPAHIFRALRELREAGVIVEHQEADNSWSYALAERYAILARACPKARPLSTKRAGFYADGSPVSG